MTLPVRNEQMEVQSRLEEVFGLKPTMIQDVIMQGLLARTSCTLHHPKTFPGLSQWAETVRSLRDKTAHLGWTPSDENNFPLCVNPSGNIAIAVYTGDRETGGASSPSNRAAKGTNTEQAVWANQKQLSLFDVLPELPEDNDGDGRIMWVLLYHVASNEIRFELSLPRYIVGGKIRSWEERLVFPSIPLDQVIPVFDEDDGPEIDIHVERK
ncbi:MAG: hypothetical protein HY846_02060 [Nitrosomonadales bacterium]|nr:hypothetical protein [Nitrosomonadales bacterium]